MIRIGVFDTAGCDIATFETNESLPESVAKRIENVKNPEEKSLKKAAYALLVKMYKEWSGEEELPQIFYTPLGKPEFFVNQDCHFNISHSKSAVAVAISNKNVGVDIQSLDMISESTAARVGARYADSLARACNAREPESTPEVLIYELRDGVISPTFCSAEIINVEEGNALCDFSSGWTRLEAALKLNGGGFAAMGSLGDVLDFASIKTLRLSLPGGEYALSIATNE